MLTFRELMLLINGKKRELDSYLNVDWYRIYHGLLISLQVYPCFMNHQVRTQKTEQPKWRLLPEESHMYLCNCRQVVDVLFQYCNLWEPHYLT